MCNSKLKLTTCTDTINEDAIEAAISIGIGFYNSEEFFNTLDVPYLTQKTYLKLQKKADSIWEEVAAMKMAEAAKEEAEYAMSAGEVDKDGVPLITVVADGCWSKRSYKTNYNAPSGAAAIIGNRFGKVLYMGVKNKFCLACSRGITRDHACAKNFSGPSTSMEAAILVEGFRLSECMYGVRYNKLIADGDSSTYNKILEARPYQTLTVEKIECRNHLLRNFCNKLRALSTDTRFPIKTRKLISKNVLRFRAAVKKAVEYRKREDPTTAHLSLKKDIDNSVNHVFGKHDECASYFCSKGNDSEPELDLIKSHTELFVRLLQIISSLSNHSRSLIKDVDSNIVERFNSIIAKCVGGKRVNFSGARSYQTRCNAAVVSFNTRRLHKTYKSHRGSNSNMLIEQLESKRFIKTTKTRQRRVKKTHNPKQREDYNYGESASKPDLDAEIYKIEYDNFISKLVKSKEELESIEKNTILQRDSGIWMELRRNLITASSFHSVCTRRKKTKSAPLVKNLLYKAHLDTPAIKHGVTSEPIALKQLSIQEDVEINPCGLFIDPERFYLGKLV